MLEIAFYSSIRVLRLFIILIVSVSLPGCLSHTHAPVSDKSSHVQSRPGMYVVAPGDTLFSIAWRHGLKYEQLAEYNGIKPPYIIRPSQVIRLDIANNTGGLEKQGRARLSPGALPQSGNGAVSKVKKPFLRQENKTDDLPKRQGVHKAGNAPQWRWPVKGVILSSFQGKDGFNKGIDLGGKLGEPVFAAAAGQVVYAGSGLRGYGKLLIIKHNETFLSAYAHNERLRVKEGDFVKAGQVIADMGSSGTDRVKLHFEIRRDGTPVDPLKYLPRR